MRVARVRTPCSALEPVGPYHSDCLFQSAELVPVTVFTANSKEVVGLSVVW
jgi:hypothetical protein